MTPAVLSSHSFPRHVPTHEYHGKINSRWAPKTTLCPPLPLGSHRCWCLRGPEPPAGHLGSHFLQTVGSGPVLVWDFMPGDPGCQPPGAPLLARAQGAVPEGADGISPRNAAPRPAPSPNECLKPDFTPEPSVGRPVFTPQPLRFSSPLLVLIAIPVETKGKDHP